jgi:hypothetical protein
VNDLFDLLFGWELLDLFLEEEPTPSTDVPDRRAGRRDDCEIVDWASLTRR